MLITCTLNINNFYKDAVDNITYNYQNSIGKGINLPLNLKNENWIIRGNLKTEHTSNLAHSINTVQEVDYDFGIKVDEKNIKVYIDDKVSEIKLDNYYENINLNSINTCNYLNKSNEIENIDGKNKKLNKYEYECDNYKLYIYTSKILNRYIKSIIKFDNLKVIVEDDSISYEKDNLKLFYSYIQEGNYVLDFKYNDKNFKVFYSHNDYDKYSFVFEKIKFNILVDNTLILSMNCNTQKYSNLKLTISKKEFNEKESYDKVEFDELISMVFSDEIYKLLE